ncbi:hypothetical protein DPEC_G00380220 [Dallia pectoralis]|nr:hypothetical protein DPEC_G00380220 [Dallia pectoralis]
MAGAELGVSEQASIDFWPHHRLQDWITTRIPLLGLLKAGLGQFSGDFSSLFIQGLLGLLVGFSVSASMDIMSASQHWPVCFVAPERVSTIALGRAESALSLGHVTDSVAVSSHCWVCS